MPRRWHGRWFGSAVREAGGVTATMDSVTAAATTARAARAAKLEAKLRQLIVGFEYDPGEDWKKRAECRDVASDVFYLADAEAACMSANDVNAENVQRNKAARAYCEECPVVAECLGYALTHEMQGTWAGELFTMPDIYAARRVRKQLFEEAS